MSYVLPMNYQDKKGYTIQDMSVDSKNSIKFIYSSFSATFEPRSIAPLW